MNKIYYYPQKNGYDHIQWDIEKSFNDLINKDRLDIKTIVIIGAHYGNEIPRLLQYYPSVHIHAIEAHPDHFQILSERYNNDNRVSIYNTVISDEPGPVTFYELSNKFGGCGSILKFQAHENGDTTYIKEILNLEATTLDILLPNVEIDLLWVDVQGAELKVLKGTTLNRCKSLFLEVNTGNYIELRHKEPYKGQCFLQDLQSYLTNFNLHSIGLDNEYNSGQGNSFWIRKHY